METATIAKMEYRCVSRRLDVWFNRGGRQRYSDVPPEIFEQLLAAPRKDVFFAENIRDRLGPS